jgi:hypothetical protein
VTVRMIMTTSDISRCRTTVKSVAQVQTESL